MNDVVYERAIERMVECGVLISHYTRVGATTLLQQRKNELDTLVRDWGTLALADATERYSLGARIQTPV